MRVPSSAIAALSADSFESPESGAEIEPLDPPHTVPLLRDSGVPLSSPVRICAKGFAESVPSMEGKKDTWFLLFYELFSSVSSYRSAR